MKKSFTIEKKDSKHSQVWEWEQTPEVKKALEKLHKPKFAGNYEGPLYAPHPDLQLKRPNEFKTTDT